MVMHVKVASTDKTDLFKNYLYPIKQWGKSSEETITQKMYNEHDSVTSRHKITQDGLSAVKINQSIIRMY